jgi:type II secretory ATPase GspE/PulE/Tfp pilus assembly ATPase PilB-like protein
MADVVPLMSLGGALDRPKRAQLLDRLVADGSISEAALARARLVSDRTAQPVEQVLNHLGALSDEALRDAYAEAAGCPVWDPVQTPPETDARSLGLSLEFLRQRRLLPLAEVKGKLICAACDPLDDEALSGLVFAANRPLSILATSNADWRRAFAETYPEEAADAAPDERRLEREIDQVAEVASDGAGARLVSQALEAAIALGASDVHFEPRRHDLRIRLRLDGRLVEHLVVSADLAAPAVSRIKVVAALDLGERRLPQDGRTSFVVEGRNVDVRVSIVPTVFGEAAVLRILDRANVQLSLDSLGFDGAPAAVMTRAAASAHGMFLVTGPTGSGKTTTLYALLQSLAGTTKKILSIEDPVEYHFDHVTQTQVAPHLGLTFASALRAFLRQDPDVILVGEIRDRETAAVATQAAMTGHLVLASVHANDVLTVAPRLLDMGLEPYQLAAGFKGAAAQRLVRRLCPKCCRERAPTSLEAAFARSVLGSAPDRVQAARGCKACQGSGFRGRLAITEAFMADEAFLRAVADRAPPATLAAAAHAAGLGSMAADGAAKAAAGLTTLEEVMAAVSD